MRFLINKNVEDISTSFMAKGKCLENISLAKTLLNHKAFVLVEEYDLHISADHICQLV